MLAKILTLVVTLIGAVGQVFAWLNSPRREADKRAADKRKIEEEVYSGDADKVNGRIKDLFGVIVVLCLLQGCTTKTIYVPSDMEAKPCVHEGVKGYFVSDALMAQFLTKLYDAKYPQTK